MMTPLLHYEDDAMTLVLDDDDDNNKGHKTEEIH